VTVYYPDAEDATIGFDDIVYWIGQGGNRLIFVVNWADTALAWGYRFSSDSVTAGRVLGDIKAVDPRFSYNGDGLNLFEIAFNDGGTQFTGPVARYWEQKVNGEYVPAELSVVLRDGDIDRWADPAAGVQVGVNQYDAPIYAYPQTIVPVSDYNGIVEAAAAGAGLRVYPNPASGEVTVWFNRSGRKSDGQTIAIYDMAGRNTNVAAIRGGDSSLTFSTASLPNGVYVIKAGEAAHKLVVRH
jgi:hypothetical protein